MDLNNIELSDLLIAELYRDTLVASQSAAAAPTQSAGTSAAPSPAGKSPSVSSPRSTVPPQAAPTPAGTAPTPGPYKFLGGNQKKITVLVQSPGLPFLPDDQLGVLTKMLEACRMSLADVAVVNYATSPVNITELRQQLRPSILLLFGVDPLQLQLPISFPNFKIQAYDGSSYLCAPSLEELVRATDESKQLKGKLWASLKTLFSV